LSLNSEIKNHKEYCLKKNIDTTNFVSSMNRLWAESIVLSKVVEIKVLQISQKGKEIIEKKKSFEIEVLEEVKNEENGILKSQIEKKIGSEKCWFRVELWNEQKMVFTNKTR